MQILKCRAVVFDLFGTLVKGADSDNYAAYIEKTITILGADPDHFRQIWSTEEMRNLRATGKLDSARAILEETCRRLDLTPGNQALQAATDLRLQAFQSWIEPRADANQVVQALKKRGFKLGLMSDCTAEVPSLWPELPFAKLFDLALFSSQLGIRKPDPRFYTTTCKKLNVPAKHCLYIGDGASSELTGATAAGMHAVLIAVPGQNDDVLPREDARGWAGPRIQSLSQVLELV